MRTYIVLEKRPDFGWLLVGQAEAHGATAAARKVAGPEATGDYLAVPVRNATFVSLGSVPQPPRQTAVEVSASEYLGEQQAMPVEEPPAETEPVAA